MGVENQGKPSSRSEDDLQLDSGWEEEPSASVESSAEAASKGTSGVPSSPIVVIGNGGSVPPSVPRPDPAASSPDDAPASGRPARPSASGRPERLTKPLIDVTAHASRLIDLPISDAATLVGSPSAPIAPAPHELRVVEPPSAAGTTARSRKPLDSEVSLLELRESSDSAVESLSPSHADRAPASAPVKRRALRAFTGVVALLGVAVVAFAVTRGPRAEQPLAAETKRAAAPLEPKVHALTPAPAPPPASEATPDAAEAAAKATPAEPAVTEPSPTEVLSEPVLPPATAPSSGAESPAPAQPSERTAAAIRVTIRTSPPGAVIFDERRRIGKDAAVVSLLPGQKRRVLALLDRHQPTHIIVDGSVETVNIELKPMAADELERAAESDRARGASAPAEGTAAARSTDDR
jgi:hypothetical protein